MVYALALLLVVVAAVNYVRYRDPLYPAFLHAALWAVLCGVLAVYEEEFWRLRPLTLLTFGTGVLCFSLGCYLSTYSVKPLGGAKRSLVDLPSRRVAWGVLGLAALILPFFVQRVFAIAASGPTQSFYINVRWMISFGGATLGPAAYGAVVSFTAVFLTLVRILRPNRTWTDIAALVTAVSVAMGFAILQTGRTSLFMLLFVLFVPPVVLRYVRPGRAAALLIGIMVIFFGLLGVVIRSTTASGSLMQTVSDAAVSLRHYFVGGAYAFDTLLAHPSPLELGANTGRFFFAIADAIGYHVDVKPLVQEFSYPFATNVYTFYQPYFLDFDLVFAIMMQFVFGIMHGSVYRWVSRQGTQTWHLFVFSILAYPLFMQFFQDQYANLLSTWIQLALVGGVAFGGAPLSRWVLSNRRVHTISPTSR